MAEHRRIVVRLELLLGKVSSSQQRLSQVPGLLKRFRQSVLAAANSGKLTAEAAEYLGVHQNTIRKWAARGDIPMQRNPVNGYRLFKRSDLDTTIEGKSAFSAAENRRLGSILIVAALATIRLNDEY